MPVEEFNYRKPANGSAEGVVPLSQAWGTRVHGTDRVGSAGTSVAPAGLHSTAPYIDEKGTHPSPLIVVGPEARHDTVYKCTATRADGSPCTARVHVEGGLCGPHTAQANRMKEYADGCPEPA